jgi:hypothetical protein
MLDNVVYYVNDITTYTVWEVLMAKKQKSGTVGFQRTHYLIPADLHKRFKLIAVEDEKSMSVIVVELIKSYVEKREKELLR